MRLLRRPPPPGGGAGDGGGAAEASGEAASASEGDPAASPPPPAASASSSSAPADPAPALASSAEPPSPEFLALQSAAEARLAALRAQLAKMRKDHSDEEAALRKKAQKAQGEVSTWINEYDKEMGIKTAAWNEKVAVFNEQQRGIKTTEASGPKGGGGRRRRLPPPGPDVVTPFFSS